jgi:hypothetical protein
MRPSLIRNILSKKSISNQLVSNHIFSLGKQVILSGKFLNFCLAIFTLWLFFPPVASDVSASADNREQFVVPENIGEVIYRVNTEQANQIYIVAQSHRSSFVGRSNVITEQVQAEIFRIGEWLIRNRDVELLLPEGYFRGPSVKDVSPAEPLLVEAELSSRIQTLDDQTLISTLADSSRFVNAGMLLHTYMGIKLQQVEDKELYLRAKNLLGQLMQLPESDDDLILNTLDYQQKKRSAVILKNIPQILEEEYNNRSISNKNVMLAIGLVHVDEMIDFITNSKIEINALAFSDENCDCDRYVESLNYLTEHFGITVILPRSLANQQDILRMAGVWRKDSLSVSD